MRGGGLIDEPCMVQSSAQSASAVFKLGQKRRHGRVLQETLSCNFGEVMDLSPGGMKVRCWRRPKGDEHIILMDNHPMNPPLRGRIVWSRRIGWIRQEVGFQFESLTA